MADQLLSDNHRRVLSVVARSIERSLDNIEDLFSRRGDPSRLRRIEISFSEQEKRGILRNVAAMRWRLLAFVREFQLIGDSHSERQVVDTKIAHMWLLLEDSFSQKLKGYGEVHESVRSKVDASVADLLRLVRELEVLK